MVSALWRSSHPGPCVVVTVLAVVLGLAAGVAAPSLVLLGAAVLAGQLSVGWSNDAIDAGRDRAVGRTDKPIAGGEVSRRTVWIAAGVAATAAIVLSALLGVGFLVAHLVALLSAWAYNGWLKRTVLSALPFAVSFGILPSLATLATAHPAVAPMRLTVAGAAIGVAVHLVNVLPDLADDAATGVRGLPHRLGARGSAVLAAVALAGGALSVALGVAGLAPAIAWVGFGVVAAAAAAGLVIALRQPSRAVFRLFMAAALVLAAQLALATALG